MVVSCPSLYSNVMISARLLKWTSLNHAETFSTFSVLPQIRNDGSGCLHISHSLRTRDIDTCSSQNFISFTLRTMSSWRNPGAKFCREQQNVRCLQQSDHVCFAVKLKTRLRDVSRVCGTSPSHKRTCNTKRTNSKQNCLLGAGKPRSVKCQRQAPEYISVQTHATRASSFLCESTARSSDPSAAKCHHVL